MGRQLEVLYVGRVLAIEVEETRWLPRLANLLLRRAGRRRVDLLVTGIREDGVVEVTPFVAGDDDARAPSL